MRASQGRLPKLNFSMFFGEDPQLWHSRCENYFEMHGVESSLWIKVASMHFEGGGGLLAGFRQLSIVFVILLGTCSAPWFTIDSVATNMRRLLGSFSTSVS
jgi:hypothetical protein